LYGDIVSDLCAGLVGGLGVVPGGNLGERCAVFEAVHGTAPDIAGKGLANPTAILLSTVMMLQWLNLSADAQRLERAIMRVYAENKVRTVDLGGTATTEEFTQAIISAL
jgi:isocitrate dehydrogenase (NAD+)